MIINPYVFNAGAASYQSTVLVDTPIAYWPMNDLTSPAVDIVGGRNATFPAPVLPNQAAIYPRLGPCMALPGTSPNYLSYTPPALGAQVAFEGWFYQTATGDQALGSIQFASGFSLDLRNGSGGPTIVWGGAGHASFAQSNIPINNPFHIVATTDAVNSYLYLNGTLMSTVAGAYPGNSAGGNGIIGARNVGSFWFKGKISNVALYNHNLSAAQIAAHYAAGNH